MLSTWNNGSWHETGAGYGFRVDKKYQHLFRGYTNITVILPDGTQANPNITQSFWGTCPDLRHQNIGLYLLSVNQGQWQGRNPFRYGFNFIRNGVILIYQLGNTAFVTYTNSRNPHTTIHRAGCGQIQKRGGHHALGQGSYNPFNNYQDARNYANNVGHPVIDCSFCNPTR